MTSKAQRIRLKLRLVVALSLSALLLSVARMLYQAHWEGQLFAPGWTQGPSHSDAEALRFSLYRVLFDYGIRVDWISGDTRHKTVRIPKDLAPVSAYAALVNEIRRLGGEILIAEASPSGETMELEVGLDAAPLFRVTLVYDRGIQRTNGKIAVVIDDFGFFYDDLIKGFLNLEQRITFSILPDLANSRRIAEAAAGRRHDVLIHMPMEPERNDFKADGHMLLTNMSPDEIRMRVRQAISLIPYASGLNNHMGSRATAHEALLIPLMTELAAAGLCFLDSRTSPQSVAFEVARELKIPCARNDTFLDSIAEEPYIRQQLYYLADLAAQRGWSVGIGHPNERTLKVMREELPRLEKRGFMFVGLSDLVK